MRLKKICWLLLTTITISTSVISFADFHAAPLVVEKSKNELIPRSLLFGNPTKVAPRISPSGKKLAYLAPDNNNILNIWVKDLEGTDPDKLVTADKKRGIRNYLWQYDENHILYEQDKDGDENSHIYQTNLLTGETRDLTPYDGVKADILSYKSRFPQTALIEMNFRDPKLFDVYRLNLMTGEITLDTENPGAVVSWQPDRYLQIRASVSIADDGEKIVSYRDNIFAPWRDILTISPSELGGHLVGLNDDNKSLYLLSSLGGNTVRLLEVDAHSGSYRTVVENKRYDIDEVFISSATNQLEAFSYTGKKYSLNAVDQVLASEFNFLDKEINNPFHIVSRDLTNKIWVIAGRSDIKPTDYYLYNRETKNIKYLFNTQPDLAAYNLSPMKPISYIARDGMKIYGYLTVPSYKDPKNLPLILLVHGGPWARDDWGLDPEVQWLANRGYAVLQINFRGSTGYGKDYLNAGNREWGNKMHTDLLDGKLWAINSGIADPQKVAIYGGSYGGYATLAALAFTPDEFSCGIDVVGPSNLITLLQTLPPYWTPGKAEMDLRIGSLEREPEFLKERSPLFKADQIKKPLMIAQGANDPRVKQNESDQIVNAMRLNHLPVEYLLFQDEGHGFARPQNRVKFYAAAEAFLAKYLDGRLEKSSPEENWEALLK